jgi:hypothetical protein
MEKDNSRIAAVYHVCLELAMWEIQEVRMTRVKAREERL